MIKASGLIIFLLTYAVQGLGAVPFDFQKDIAEEIQSSDFLSLTSGQKAKWVAQLYSGALDLKTTRQIVDEASGVSVSDRSFSEETRYITIQQENKLNLESYLPILGEKTRLESNHAIQNLTGYIQNRIGTQLFNHLQKQKQKTFVIGSDPLLFEKDLRNILPKGTYKMTPIPSLYEKWGLHRFWVESITSNESYYFLVVPPSIQYIRHYVSVLDSAALHSSSRGLLSHKAQKNLKENLRKFASDIHNNFGDLDVLFFGYEKNWMDSLNQEFSLFKLVETRLLSTSFGLNVQLMRIQNKKNSKIIKVGSLQPQQTIWGELATFYFQALLKLKPEIVLFMGSAGAIKPELKPYQVSVPEEFVAASGLVKVENWILMEKTAALTEDVFQTARHGNTFSPIQQRKEYVKTLVSSEIETVDVEQALVAEMIEDYNNRNKVKIKFGAINVITDQPGQVLLAKQSSQHDLDKLDFKAKSRAKDKSAEIALSALAKWVQSRSAASESCKKLFQ